VSVKHLAKRVLQRAFGFHRYLVAHSVFVALTLRFRRDEGAVLQFLARISPDAFVLDIGANVGTMTLLFARRARRGTVYAFEPIPENIRATAAIVKLFRLRNVKLFPIGLGERDEQVTMVMPSSDGVRLEGLSHVVRDGEAAEGMRYDVRLARLDTLPELRGRRVDAIKIDVEDHEQFVLRGAERIIARDLPVIYCELWSPENQTACFALLERYGYRPFVVHGNGVAPYDPASDRAINFLFLPPARAVAA
jgi:FkbM family methyltransferase